jgi:hypothetical protein
LLLWFRRCRWGSEPEPAGAVPGRVRYPLPFQREFDQSDFGRDGHPQRDLAPAKRPFQAPLSGRQAYRRPLLAKHHGVGFSVGHDFLGPEALIAGQRHPRFRKHLHFEGEPRSRGGDLQLQSAGPDRASLVCVIPARRSILGLEPVENPRDPRAEGFGHPRGSSGPGRTWGLRGRGPRGEDDLADQENPTEPGPGLVHEPETDPRTRCRQATCSEPVETGAPRDPADAWDTPKCRSGKNSRGPSREQPRLHLVSELEGWSESMGMPCCGRDRGVEGMHQGVTPARKLP